MIRYKCTRNEQVAELVGYNDGVVILRLEDGEEKIIAESTLKRWWQRIEGEDSQARKEAATAKEAVKEKPVKQEPKPKAAPKKPAIKAPDVPNEVSNKFFELVDKMKEIHEGITVFESDKVPGFYSLKVDGKIYMAFSVTKKAGFTLWLRTAAIDGIIDEYQKMNHMFDARLKVTHWDTEVYNLIRKLHDASLKFQKDKNASRKK